MRLIDADEVACWACKHTQNAKGTCDTGMFGCDSYERFERRQDLDRLPFCGGPTVINAATVATEHAGETCKPDKVSQHGELCKALNALYERKNHDYGDSFGQTYAEEGLAMARIRLSDKLNRFKMLTRSAEKQEVSDESIRDTLLDLANYALMTVLEIDADSQQSRKEEQNGC